LAEVAREPLLAFSRAEYPEYHQWLDLVFRPSGLTPRVVEEHDGGSSLIAAAEAGRGVALVLSCFSCLVGPRLHLKPLQPAPEPFVVGAAYNAQRLGPVARRFIGLLRRLPKSG
jgi:DNA-binding transcriptional LysR family regulator